MVTRTVNPLGTELPDEWHVRPLGAMCSKIGSGATPKGGSEVYKSSGISFIRSQNVFDHRFSRTGLAFIDDESAERLNVVKVHANDVLLNITGDGDTIARCCVVTPDVLPARVNQHVAIIRPQAELIPGYLQRYLSHPRIREYMLSHNSGGSRRALTKAQIERFLIVVPPLSEQRAIAEVLGALDDKIVVNERITTTALAAAKAQYSLASASVQAIIGDLATVFDGPHATPHKTPQGPWFLSISSLKGGVLDLSESAHLSEDDFPRWTKRVQPQAGDVLFSYETRLGEAALMPPGVRASLGRRMALLRTKDDTVSGTLLLHAYLSSEFQAEVQRRTVHGATVDRIPLKEMSAWPISLPAEEKRADLIGVLDALHAIIEQTANENRTLAALRDTLLPQLVTGKLRIKDAERVVEDAV